MLKFISPLIVVEDMARARRFYEHTLGQTVKADFGENVTFVGDFSIHLKPHFQGLLGDPKQYPVTRKSNDGELYFETDEIEDVSRRLEEASVEFVHRIIEQPWGQRVLRFYDPDGHLIEIGEPLEVLVRRLSGQGMTVDTIMEKTFLPREYIELILQPS